MHVHARAGLHALEVKFGKFSVSWELRDAEIRGAIAHVRESLSREALDQLDHVINVLGSSHDMFGHFEVQGPAVIQERLNILVGELTNAQAGRSRFLNDAIVNVSEIHD